MSDLITIAVCGVFIVFYLWRERRRQARRKLFVEEEEE